MSAAQKSYRWFVRAHIDLPHLEFAYQFLSRTGRMPDDRLKLILPDFMAAYEVFKKRMRHEHGDGGCAEKPNLKLMGEVNNGFFERDGGKFFMKFLDLRVGHQT